MSAKKSLESFLWIPTLWSEFCESHIPQVFPSRHPFCQGAMCKHFPSRLCTSSSSFSCSVPLTSSSKEKTCTKRQDKDKNEEHRIWKDSSTRTTRTTSIKSLSCFSHVSTWAHVILVNCHFTSLMQSVLRTEMSCRIQRSYLDKLQKATRGYSAFTPIFVGFCWNV